MLAAMCMGLLVFSIGLPFAPAFFPSWLVGGFCIVDVLVVAIYSLTYSCLCLSQLPWVMNVSPCLYDL